MVALARTMTGNILIVSGNERIAMVGEWLGLTIFCPLVACGALLWGVDGIIRAATVSAAVFLPVAACLLSRAIPLRPRDLAAEALPAIVAALIMSLSVATLPAGVSTVPIFGFAVKAAAGGSLFVMTIFGLWWFRGCPEGVEHAVTRFLTSWLAKRAES
jgi:hypothetical protein